MTWNVVIVDDEAPARRNLVYSLAEHPQWQLVGNCRSAEEVRATLGAHHVDLLLLDIYMPKENGLQLAEWVCQQPSPPLVVFVTAYDRHAIAAFELYALDYILKPFDDGRFARTLARADGELRQRRRPGLEEDIQTFISEQRAHEAGMPVPPLRYVVVRSMGFTERVAIADVMWIKSAGNYVELHTQKRCILHRSSFSQLETRLPMHEFIRVHRTAIVRRSAIRRVSIEGDRQYSVTLESGDVVPVSERHIAAVRSEFGGG